LPKVAIFDLDGTLLDSVDLHALAWQEAMLKFGHDVSFEQVRGQIGKGGDKLIPFFCLLANNETAAKNWKSGAAIVSKPNICRLYVPSRRSQSCSGACATLGFRSQSLPRPRKMRSRSTLDIAGIADLVDLKTSSDDVEESKPAPDIFEIVLKKLKIQGADAVAIGDTPYDAEAAGKAGIATIGVLCGGFAESSLRQAGSAEVYPGPAALLALFERSLLGK